jgi:L-threonylcarbamoyladenylate synthase
MIIDSGSVMVGLESTVADVTGGGVVVLRPGGITPEQLGGVAGDVTVDPALFPTVTPPYPRPPV